jgi:hypothetical protein
MTFVFNTNAGVIRITNIAAALEGGNLTPEIKLFPSKGYLTLGLIFKLENDLGNGSIQEIEFTHQSGPIYFDNPENPKFDATKLSSQVVTYLSQFLEEPAV